MVFISRPARSASSEGACGKPEVIIMRKAKSSPIEPRARGSIGPRRGKAPSRRFDDFLVVGLGASAGGLEALYKLFDAFPPDTGMAFVLIQHLDPSHKSMMTGLLASHTAMKVLEATDGMPIE